MHLPARGDLRPKFSRAPNTKGPIASYLLTYRVLGVPVLVFRGDRAKAAEFYLRGQGVTPQPIPPAACTPVQRMVGDYRIYLAQERGLVAGTTRRYVRDARLFLTEYLARDDSDFGALTPGEVTDFVLRECRRRGPGSARNLVASLRSLLRICYLQGHTARQLAPAVPAAAGVPCRTGWRPGR